jgi:hypothetical protein
MSAAKSKSAPPAMSPDTLGQRIEAAAAYIKAEISFRKWADEKQQKQDAARAQLAREKKEENDEERRAKRLGSLPRCLCENCKDARQGAWPCPRTKN